ncbi:Nickel transport system permease protein NikB [Vibrio aerogenes CECT 7868]|uniref:Nickel transport system permease protein NikB n=1 Tax=Vibrio aerogenes CECT 7868 TaxID=1216006 RepID=A0A1M6DCT6_9VIBR|nr:ABC transporter permease [Vibrio aerogenes]SHI70818.1 Nickel transport system permease protein NikB [Vibrio aerogenes CECT 7868]
MIKLLIHRLYQAVFVAWSVGTITFIMMKMLPGDMAFRIAAGRYGYDYVNLDAAKAVSKELGLEQSAISQYFSWLWDLCHFHLGNSLLSGESVAEKVFHHLGYSLWLALIAVLVSLLIAFPVGVYCGRHAGSASDKAALFFSGFMRAQPVFLIGLILILLFALHLHWLPVAGFGSPEHVILPAVALALSLAALSNRMVRNTARTVFRAPFYRFARFKGLTDAQTYQRHGRLNIALPVMAFIGVQAVGLIEGIVMIESLFSWPGIGHALSHAVFSRDVPVIQGAALLMGLLFVAINTLIDMIQYQLDPRYRQDMEVAA